MNTEKRELSELPPIIKEDGHFNSSFSVDMNTWIQEHIGFRGPMIALNNRPTCIIFPDDYSYLGSMKVLQEAGLRVPEDISAMGYDGIRLARVIGLTTYRQDTETLGRAACRRLIEKIENPEAMTEQTVVMGHLVPGETVGEIKVVTGE